MPFCVDEQREQFLARLNVSHSCVVRCQGTSFGGVVAAAVLVARHDSSSVSVLPFQLGSREVSEQAVTDPVLRAGPATFSLAQDDVGASNSELGGNRLRTFIAVRLLFSMCKTRSRAKSFTLKNSNQPWPRANYQISENNSHDVAMMMVSKVAHAHRTVHCAGRPIDGPPTLCFALQSCGCHGRSR